MTKTEIRETCLERRRALSRQDVLVWSKAIEARMRALDELMGREPVLTYLSSMDNEVATLGLVEDLLADGREVLVPTSRRDRTLTWSRIESLSEVAPSKFGILEPLPDLHRPVPVPRDGVALVPGIAFTREGYRIGYGAGYYDCFLSGFGGAKVGLAFEIQLINEFPVEAHDVPVDVVVTEALVYRKHVPRSE